MRKEITFNIFSLHKFISSLPRVRVTSYFEKVEARANWNYKSTTILRLAIMLSLAVEKNSLLFMIIGTYNDLRDIAKISPIDFAPSSVGDRNV